MKVAKKLTLVLLIAAMVLVTFVACLPNMGGNKKEYDEPEDFEFEVTATTIKFVIDDYMEISVNGEVLEYRIENGEWQDSPLFEGLTPNTKYNVYVRVKENDNYKASKEHSQEVTTLKYSQSAPNVSYELVEKTVTVQSSSELEYSFDGGVTYGSVNTHTYTDKGDKTILVRYKETDDKFSGEAQVINVKITDYYGGSGTETDPYLLLTEEHFIALRNETTTNSCFKLMGDLDFSSKTFYPAKIGGSSVFDGNGHKIANINYEIDQYSRNIGVFTIAGTVKNLTLENVNINYECDKYYCSSTVGLLAASANNIDNCQASGEINIKDTSSYNFVIGGLVGGFNVPGGTMNRFSITNSLADVKITYESQSTVSSGVEVGGLLGQYINATDAKDNYVTISKCGANVDIDLSGTYGSVNKVAGLVGSNIMGKIVNCYATGKITTSGNAGNMMMGGIIAQVAVRTAANNDRYGNASIESCYANMDLYADRTNQGVRMGGISSLMQAYAAQTVTNCFFAGTMAVSSGGKDGFMDSFATSVLANYTQVNCYHSDNLVSPVESGESIAAAVETMKTIAWQRDTLKFSEDVWNFVEGQYPTLK
ncbi:MAG: hypothetical protein K2G37_00560 [Clostridia bacterium]|nr:hypothetical protein [Clostridia bacterium]MDE7328503.1 hypothetical protein [Clostridia bacterium]